MNEHVNDSAESVKPKVLVMLAAYNGSEYLRDQIDSILAQQDVDVSLVITDDRSTDDTATLCQEYADHYGNVQFCENEVNQGSTRTFFSMIEQADSDAYDYFALSDQDDFWFSNKLIAAIDALRRDSDCAWLYYSDVMNCTPDLTSVIKGGAEYYSFALDAHNLKTLLCANWASGNTMVFDAVLLRLLQKSLPKSCPRIHDTWIHLVALSCGTTYADLDNSYIARRISGRNQVGVRGFGALSSQRIKGSIRAALSPSEKIWINTARELYARYSQDMTVENRTIVKQFIETESSLGARLKAIVDLEYRLPKLLDTATMKMRFLLNKN